MSWLRFMGKQQRLAGRLSDQQSLGTCCTGTRRPHDFVTSCMMPIGYRTRYRGRAVQGVVTANSRMFPRPGSQKILGRTYRRCHACNATSAASLLTLLPDPNS